MTTSSFENPEELNPFALLAGSPFADLRLVDGDDEDEEWDDDEDDDLDDDDDEDFDDDDDEDDDE